MVFVLILFVLITIVALVYYVTQLFATDARNPFQSFTDKLTIDKSTDKVVIDEAARNKVIKKTYKSAVLKNEVEQFYDVIIAGGGVSGLAAGVVMAKSGRRVLVLEAHDRAGGGGHTFEEAGFEWDVGLHYIGDCAHGSVCEQILKELTDCKLKLAPMTDPFDVIVHQDNTTGKLRKWEVGKNFLEQFPGYFPNEETEARAVVAAFKAAKQKSGIPPLNILVKVLPSPITNLLAATGILKLFDKPVLSITDVISKISSNKEMELVFSYLFGDYGMEPNRAPFNLHCDVLNHFLKSGAYYPVGGAAEIAHCMIPLIEKPGGKVLMQAPVAEVLVDEGPLRVRGVRLADGSERYAPIVISSVGIGNLVNKLLPDVYAQKLKVFPLYKSVEDDGNQAKNLRPGAAGFNVFVGFDKSSEELRLPQSNFWMFTDVDINKALERWSRCESLEEALKEHENDEFCPPLMFASFPSAKDPSHDDRRPNKATATLITFTPYSWWADMEKSEGEDRNMPSTSGRRSTNYKQLKKELEKRMFGRLCSMMPHLEEHMVYMDSGTPLTNQHYLNCTHGEIYGLEHSQYRFAMEASLRLRPETEIKGLYLTGQDILTAGIFGGLYSGIITCQRILNRNIVSDLAAGAKKSKAVARALKAGENRKEK